MLSKNTVVILGAGASMPYGFPSGRDLLRSAQAFQTPETLADFIKSPASAGARPLFDALRDTLDQSIDAMLETLPSVVVDAGKGFIARYLLNREFDARTRRPNPTIDPQKVGYPWIHYVWNALDLRSLKDFQASPIQFVTYNYDRSLEHALYQGVRAKHTRQGSLWRRERQRPDRERLCNCDSSNPDRPRTDPARRSILARA
jgi:hypothetical protein